jgi:hypothetical protein
LVASQLDESDVEASDIAALLRGYEPSFRAPNRSSKSIQGYLRTVTLFREFLDKAGMPTRVDWIMRRTVLDDRVG